MDPNIASEEEIQQPSTFRTKPSIIKQGFIAAGILLLLIIVFVSAYQLTSINNTSQNNVVHVSPTITNTPTTLPSSNSVSSHDVLDSTLYFQRNNTLYKLYPLDGTPVPVLDPVSRYAFSPDYKTIAYIPEYGEGDNSVIFVDTETYTPILTIPPENNMSFRRGFSWSPQGTYLLVNEGTGPEGSNTTYIADTGEEAYSFSDGAYRWISDDAIITTTRESVEPMRPWGSGDGNGVARMNILTGNQETLFIPDTHNDYRVADGDDTCVYIENTYVQSPDEWADTNSSRYYCYHKTTRELHQIDTPTPEREKYITTIRNAHPEYADNATYPAILDLQQHSEFPNWLMFAPYIGTGNTADGSDIMLIDLKNPESSLQHIVTGASYTWIEERE